ncbi:COX15/CtaA family protein [Labrys monachus]|uniref:Heme A synthase n=1 Tax=Labrys monachus TaxID=217067 RepID=A0ABU0FGR2_9HYPH|nr:COX15/CtaA family protein [Labrys monachus]MDQ0393793.1 cytochrome c oxidase assembly protein subunit 15 [Labrys monachus]
MTAIASGSVAAAPGNQDHYGVIRAWLIVVALMIVAMVVVGGATRLTNSGLSIVEWKPVTGVVPPLTDTQWDAAFAQYRTIPQYTQLNLGMSLDDFKFIYWWEWSHRLLGRLIGFVFFVPLMVFWVRGWLTRALAWRLVGLLVLGGSQGLLGWWMVASGLENRTEVSQYRLAMHMTLACIIFTATVWVAASLTRRADGDTLPRLAKAIAALLVPLVLVQIFMGGLVAGLRAGLSYNTWPLMDGHFLPSTGNLYIMAPAWANHFENALTVQFQHRMVAYLIVLLALFQAFLAIRHGSGAARDRAVLIGLVALGQAAIGIMTLLLVVPLWSAILHQLGGVVLLAAVTVHAQRLTTTATALPAGARPAAV